MHQTMDKTRAPASKTLIEIDLSESPYKNDMIHNRWHLRLDRRLHPE